MATYEEESWLQRTKKTMKDMTWKQRLGYLWDYYKWVAIAAVVVIAVGISIVSSVSQNTKNLLYSGVAVNVNVSEEATAYLTDDLFAKLQGDKKEDRLELMPMAINLGENAYTELEMANSQKLLAMVTTQEVDYLLMDAASIRYCGNNGLIGDLSKVLSQEMLAKFEGKIVTIEDEESEYPGAIDISDIPFVKKHLGSADKVYIAFTGNTERSSLSEMFLQYLLDWKE